MLLGIGIVWFLGALLAGATAAEKGLSFIAYFLFGLLFTPLFALIAVAAVPADQDKLEAGLIKAGKRQACPSCLSAIPVEASVCRYCGRDVSA